MTNCGPSFKKHLANECRNKIQSLINKRLLLKRKGQNKGQGEISFRNSKQKHYEQVGYAI